MGKSSSKPWLRTVGKSGKKVWYYTDSNGKQISLRCEERDEKEAYRRWAMLMAGDTNRPASAVFTVADTVETFLQNYKTTKSEKSYTNAKSILSRFKTAFKEVPLEDLNSKAIKAWIKSVSSWNDPGRQVAKKYLSIYFEFLVSEEIIQINPCRRIKGFNIMPRGKDCLIDADTAQKIIDAAKPPFKAFLQLLLLTGCRPSELRTLQIEEVNLSKMDIVKLQHKTAYKGKSRVILLTDDACTLLKQCIGGRTTGLVLLNSVGKPWSVQAVGDRWRRIRAGLGLPKAVVPYSLRHSYACQLLEQGVPEQAVASFLGHSSTRTLHANYSHLCDRVREYRHLLDGSPKTS
jgi:integrase